MFFVLLRSARLKAACKMLMKLTHVVNVTNILQAAIASIFFPQKIQSQTSIRETLCKALLYKKGVRKMLVKLKPGEGHRRILNVDPDEQLHL